MFKLLGAAQRASRFTRSATAGSAVAVASAVSAASAAVSENAVPQRRSSAAPLAQRTARRAKKASAPDTTRRSRSPTPTTAQLEQGTSTSISPPAHQSKRPRVDHTSILSDDLPDIGSIAADSIVGEANRRMEISNAALETDTAHGYDYNF